MESKLSELMQSAMNSVKRLVEVNNIIGEPINTADGLTLVPISKVSFGFGGAGGRLPGNNKDDFGGGSATGVKIEPMINVMPPAQNSVDRLFELVPQVLDKVNFKD